MKNSLVLTLTLHELIHILYAHFLKKGVVKPNQYGMMSFGSIDAKSFKCELYNEAETDVLDFDPNEKHKSGRMIRIEED